MRFVASPTNPTRATLPTHLTGALRDAEETLRARVPDPESYRCIRFAPPTDRATTHFQHAQTSLPHRHVENSTLHAEAFATPGSNPPHHPCDNHNRATSGQLHARNSRSCLHYPVLYRSRLPSAADDDRDTAHNS